MLFQLHTQTLFCAVSEFAVRLVQDHWWQLPPAPAGASTSQIFLSPWKPEIMVSLKVRNSSSQLSSCAVSGGFMSVGIFFLWKQWRSFPVFILDVCEDVANLWPQSPPLFTPQDFSNFIDKLTLNPCFMQVTDKSSSPLWAHTDKWRHLSTLSLSQIKTLACFLETFSQISGCCFQLRLAKTEISILLPNPPSACFFHHLEHQHHPTCNSGVQFSLDHFLDLTSPTLGWVYISHTLSEGYSLSHSLSNLSMRKKNPFDLS